MSYFSRAAIPIWLWTYWSAAMLFRATALALAMLVLVPWLLRDFFPKRKSKPLTSQALQIALEPLEVKLYAMDCFEVICAGLVWEKTRIKLDENL
jgi:hypothetical protein